MRRKPTDLISFGIIRCQSRNNYTCRMWSLFLVLSIMFSFLAQICWPLSFRYFHLTRSGCITLICFELYSHTQDTLAKLTRKTLFKIRITSATLQIILNVFVLCASARYNQSSLSTWKIIGPGLSTELPSKTPVGRLIWDFWRKRIRTGLYVRPAKTQISLASAQTILWVAKDSLADSEYSAHLAHMRRLIWDFGRRTCNFVGIVVSAYVIKYIFSCYVQGFDSCI